VGRGSRGLGSADARRAVLIVSRLFIAILLVTVLLVTALLITVLLAWVGFAFIVSSISRRLRDTLRASQQPGHQHQCPDHDDAHVEEGAAQWHAP
jgi:hypothetical protein